MKVALITKRGVEEIIILSNEEDDDEDSKISESELKNKKGKTTPRKETTATKTPKQQRT